LGIGSKLRVISTLYSNCLHTDKIKDPHGDPLPDGLRPFSEFFLQHKQFGVGVKGGLEALCHYLRLQMEINPDKLFIKLDIVNAFNEFLRQAGIDVLAQEFPDTVQLIANFYSRHAATHFEDSQSEIIRILIEAGSSQGDVYGGLLFAAAFSKALQSTQDKFASEGVEVLAYYDDTYLMVSSRLANRVVKYFAQQCRELNLEFNLSKSSMFRPSGAPIPDTVLPSIAKRDGGIIVCGCPQGTDDYVKEQMQEVVQRYTELHELTRALPDTQSQYLLLRFCTCTNITFWLRTVPPELTEEFAQQFDQEVLYTAYDMLGIDTGQADYTTEPLTDLQIAQLRQHLQKGGLGLTSAEGVIHAAWVGSWCLTKELIHSLFSSSIVYNNLLDNLSANPWDFTTFRQVSSSWGQLRDVAARVSKPIVELDKLNEWSVKGQRRLHNLNIEAADRQILELAHSTGEEDRARILSCRHKESGAFLNAIPKLPFFRLSPVDFRIALNLRLGRPQSCIPRRQLCLCGDAVDPRGYHYLTCKYGGHLISRHNNLVTVGHAMVRASGTFSSVSGLQTHLEGHLGRDGKRLIPDQLAHEWGEDGLHTLFDYAVCHPCASSYVGQAASTSGAAADNRQRRKRDKYAGACSHEGFNFRAPIFETFGAYSAHMGQFMTEAQQRAANQLPDGTIHTWTSAKFSQYYRQRFSVSLQRGNAKAIRYRSTRDFSADPAVDAPHSPGCLSDGD
jgi:hypothetical protein